MHIATIEFLAVQMRNAIDAVPREALPFPMSSFPAGACGDASLLLGAYLADRGHMGFEYISGKRGSHVDDTWTSHAWLARGELVVDITADQFSDAPSKVVVAEPSLWHHQFEVESMGASDFRVWSGPGTDHLHAMYARLRPLLFQKEAQ